MIVMTMMTEIARTMMTVKRVILMMKSSLWILIKNDDDDEEGDDNDSDDNYDIGDVSRPKMFSAFSGSLLQMI